MKDMKVMKKNHNTRRSRRPISSSTSTPG